MPTSRLRPAADWPYGSPRYLGRDFGSAAPGRHEKDSGRKHHLVARRIRCEGLGHFSFDQLTEAVRWLLLFDQPARGTHDASVLGFLRGVGTDDVRRLAPDLDAFVPCALEDRAYVIRFAESQGPGCVRRLRRRRPEMPEYDFVGDQPMPVFLECGPARKTQPPAGPRRTQ